jgi:hypothetical protein
MRVRVGALKAYSKLGWLEEQDVSLVKNLLVKDKVFAIREQALELISDLLDRRLLSAVEEAAEKDPDPRVRRSAMEVALRLQRSVADEKALSDVKGEVERIKSELRERLTSRKLA